MPAHGLDPRNRTLVQASRFLLLFGGLFVWWFLTRFEWLPPFFFGDPVGVATRLVTWFTTGSVFKHLYVTLIETLLAFGIGTVLGLSVGLWLALNPFMAEVLDPFIKAFNSMPRLIFAPVFALWFGLGRVLRTRVQRILCCSISTDIVAPSLMLPAQSFQRGTDGKIKNTRDGRAGLICMWWLLDQPKRRNFNRPSSGGYKP
jgi:ABC-type phosphate transport system permease subunit